jgi:hypothetical protein
VNGREAKRLATGMLARFARDRAETGRSHLASGFFAFAPEVIDPDDTERVASAFDTLAEELERRVTGERKTPRFPAIDPDQLSWVDIPEEANA